MAACRSASGGWSGLQRLQARKPARFGAGRRGVEGDVLAPGQPRRAGRPAIHAGGAHRIVEDAVGGGVARPPPPPSAHRRSRCRDRWRRRLKARVTWFDDSLEGRFQGAHDPTVGRAAAPHTPILAPESRLPGPHAWRRSARRRHGVVQRIVYRVVYRIISPGFSGVPGSSSFHAGHARPAGLRRRLVDDHQLRRHRVLHDQHLVLADGLDRVHLAAAVKERARSAGATANWRPHPQAPPAAARPGPVGPAARAKRRARRGSPRWFPRAGATCR